MTFAKLIVLIVSFILALLISAAFPGRIAAGGAGQMIVMIFLTVGFKAAIEYFLSKRKRKREAKHDYRPLA
ncbi:MAG TPA: hypothetical protein VG938_08240 [Verrucomicrobiae bacterium]|jgi:hypothetical protein|nr:hypothetical protein [Verrucomicrobiae bacterium]